MSCVRMKFSGVEGKLDTAFVLSVTVRGGGTMRLSHTPSRVPSADH